MYMPEDHPDHGAFIWMVKNSVVPRPIAWVSSVDLEGRRNLAPYSYFNLVTMDPPTLMVSMIGKKDSLDNAQATGEFVVNLATDGQAEAMTHSAAIVPAGVDEAAMIGLKWAESTAVRAPRLADAAVALECKVLQITAFLGTHVVFAQVVGVHVKPEMLDETGRIKIGAYKPIGRLGGSLYTTVTEEYKFVVPSAEQFMAMKSSQAAE